MLANSKGSENKAKIGKKEVVVGIEVAKNRRKTYIVSENLLIFVPL